MLGAAHAGLTAQPANSRSGAVRWQGSAV